MQPPAPQRRLAAILAADIVGFSRMMGADEDGTLARLKRLREEITDPAVGEFRGRIFKTTGDGLLAEFPSVVDAVQCAAKIQVELARRAASEPADRRIVLRIGVNLGDVLVEGDDLYGDGVNVAARLEGIADPGGVAVSASAHDQVRARAGLEFVDRGEHQVKNIARPVRVYAVDLRSHGVAIRRKPLFGRRAAAALLVAALAAVAVGLYFARGARPPPAGASIAVLPFANQSGDPRRDYFSDGVTEDIINALGRFSALRVSSRNAVQAYKGRAAPPEEVSRDLGVRYLVHGSVREADGRLRVAVELSDATRATVLWSDRYDGEGKEVFDMQDRIVRNIVGMLAVKVTALEQQRALAKPPESLEAYDLVLRARDLLLKIERGPNREARALAAQALRLAPNYAEAHVVLAEGEFQRAVFGFVEDVQESLQRAVQSAKRALALNDPGAHARAHAVLGAAYSFEGRFEDALAASDQAIALNASDAWAHGLRADVLLWTGRIEESIAAAETAFRYDPRTRGEVGFDLSMGYYLAGRYREALAAAETQLARTPDSPYVMAVRAAALAQLGQAEQARAAAARVMELQPFFEVARFGERFVNPAHREKAREGLRKAGL